METILVVDDDSHIRDVVTFSLKQNNYKTIEAEDGLAACEIFNNHNPDLVILDIMMPEIDGFEVCRRIRSNSIVPIVFLTSKDDEIEKILGIEMGGDDYITKPFSPRELVARVKAIFRRKKFIEEHNQSSSTQSLIKHNDISIDTEKYKAFADSNEVILTATEFGLLKTLISNPHKVYNRNELMDGAYDFNCVVSDRTIDSHVRRIRSKFKKFDIDPIETVHGIGYKCS